MSDNSQINVQINITSEAKRILDDIREEFKGATLVFLIGDGHSGKKEPNLIQKILITPEEINIGSVAGVDVFVHRSSKIYFDSSTLEIGLIENPDEEILESISIETNRGKRFSLKIS